MTQPIVYRSPSREYLVKLLNNMRESSARAQRSLASYQAVLSQIHQSVTARAEQEEWDAEAQRLVFRVESENSKTAKAAYADYLEWRDNARWHADVLRTEASVYYMLGDPPEPEPVQDPMPVDLMTPAAAEHTQIFEALTGEEVLGAPSPTG